jgi:hypothetical protein
MIYEQMLTKTAVKERGWTDAGIKKFLGEPDTTKRNPRYGNAAPMSLYKVERVEAVEKTDEFAVWKTKSEVRKSCAAKAVQTKTSETVAAIDGWIPRIPTLKLNEVKRQAIESYNDYNTWSEDHKSCNKNSDPLFLERIMVNYIRHELTEYDELLSMLGGWIGIREAIELVRERVYTAIAEKYPKLADECSRQKMARTNSNAINPPSSPIID